MSLALPDPPPTVAAPWLDKRGLAEHLSCSVRSIERAMTCGLPYAVIFGRAKFRPSEVEVWLEARGDLERHGEPVVPGAAGLDEGRPAATQDGRLAARGGPQ